MWYLLSTYVSTYICSFFFLFIHYSHATYQIMAQSVSCLRSGGMLQAPLCPPPRPVPRRCEVHQGNYKRKESERDGQRKEQRETTAQPLNRSCRRHEVGRGQEQWSPPSTRLLGPAPCSPTNSRSSASDTSLTASSSAGTRLPTPLIRQEVPDLPPPVLRPVEVLPGQAVPRVARSWLAMVVTATATRMPLYPETVDT